MLRNQPSGFRAITTNQLFVRPTNLFDDLAQFVRVVPVYGFHTRVIAMIERTVLCQFFAHAQVALLQTEKSLPKVPCVRSHGGIE